MPRIPRPGAVRDRHGLTLPRDERVLAWARAADGSVVAGSRDALHAREADGSTLRIAWEQVEAADWDQDTGVLRVSEAVAWGSARPEHTWTFEDTGRLLELVRERVTASVLFQRHVPVSGRRGLRVIARRAPSGTAPVQWVYEYDEGVDPDDPTVRASAAAALAQAREQLGEL
ncbi:hypothetical protein [uncultured Nocardioides sp.]|jgi:hypothetical protein|uniref:hypothetical protein n=1 Tax=uncultured Nocardioides sp. TaxID=198441 RepID=UPI002633CDA8|nr:hypothetical protein [uncultured Nocardioides sp.]